MNLRGQVAWEVLPIHVFELPPTHVMVRGLKRLQRAQPDGLCSLFVGEEFTQLGISYLHPVQSEKKIYIYIFISVPPIPTVTLPHPTMLLPNTWENYQYLTSLLVYW